MGNIIIIIIIIIELNIENVYNLFIEFVIQIFQSILYPKKKIQSITKLSIYLLE